MSIHSESNIVYFSGGLDNDDIFRASQLIYGACERRGYREVILDFIKTTSTFETFMVPLTALCRDYSGKGFNFEVLKPEQDALRSLFHNSNWNYLINPQHEDETTYSGAQHAPAKSYRNGDDLHVIVNRIMDVILGSLTLERKQLAALEWSINEIADNVLNHAQSRFGGVIQATTYIQNNSVEFVVADAGIGIPRSLKERDNRVALTRAIQEGVTRDKINNQGNGLFGSFRVASLSGGSFTIHSGKASLKARGSEKVSVTEQQNRIYPGTIVISRIVCGQEKLIEQALSFKGKPYTPGNDYIESHYEVGDGSELVFSILSESPGFGTREAGRVVKNKINNLLRTELDRKIVIDFENIHLITSSFADEAIAKPYVQLGPIAFTNRVEFRNIEPTIRSLIDRSILLRSSQPFIDDIA